MITKYTFRKNHLGRMAKFEVPIVTFFGMATGQTRKGYGKIVGCTVMPSEHLGGLFCLVIETKSGREIIDSYYVTLSKRFGIF